MNKYLQDYYEKELLKMVDPGPLMNEKPFTAKKKKFRQRVRDWIIDKIREKVGYYDE